VNLVKFTTHSSIFSADSCLRVLVRWLRKEEEEEVETHKKKKIGIILQLVTMAAALQICKTGILQSPSRDGLSAQATLWSSKSRSSFVTLSSSFVRSRKQGMHKRVIKICAAANKEEATTHGPTSSIPPKKLLEPEIQQTTSTPEMEREIWDMFMRAEANEEKALDASQEDARVRVATTTAVLEPPGKKMGKFEGNKYLFCTEGTGKVHVQVKKGVENTYVVDIKVETGTDIPRSELPLKLHWVRIPQ